MKEDKKSLDLTVLIDIINTEMSDYLDPNNEELLKDFFLEAELQVETFEQNILVLENEPHNKDAVDEIFRAAHTLKGAAGTVQMDELSHFTHLCEDTLDEIRAGNIEVTPEVVDIILEAIDIIKAMLEARTEGEIYQEDISSTSGKLEEFISGKAPQTAAEPEAGADESPAPSEGVKLPSEYELLELNEQCTGDEKLVAVHIVFNEDNPMNTVGGVQVYAALQKNGNILNSVPDFDELYKDVFHPEADFYIATEKDLDEIKASVAIPDVVLDSSIGYAGETGDDEAQEEEASEPGPAADTASAEKEEKLPRSPGRRSRGTKTTA